MPDVGVPPPDADVPITRCDEAAASQSVAGCYFVQTLHTVDVPPEPPAIRGCSALLVANPNNGPVAIRLRYGANEEDAAPYARLVKVDGTTVNYLPLPAGLLPPAATAIISTLHVPYSPSPDPPTDFADCPSIAFIEGSTTTPQAISVIGQRTQGIELLSDAPVLAINLHHYQLQSQVQLDPLWDTASDKGYKYPHQLLPAPLWDAKPIETGTFKPGRPSYFENPDIDTGCGTHWDLTDRSMHGRTSIIASAQNTNVAFTQLDGTTTMLTLDRGETYTYLTEDAFVGKSIAADKPVALVSAIGLFLPWDYPFGVEPDGAQGVGAAMPRATWGSEYVAVRHFDRWPDTVEQPPWRIIGGEDGTSLSYAPYRPVGAPDHVDRGELVIFEADAPFVVRSQDAAHPFFLGGHMTGGRYALQRAGHYPNEVSRGGGVSYAEIPVARWTKRYPFFALPDWPEQSLVIVRRRGGKDITLDCAGVLTGWQPAGDDYEYTYAPLVARNFQPVTYGSTNCYLGPHWIESEEPFRATLWGLTSVSQRIEFHDGCSMTTHTSSAYAVPLFGYDAPPPAVE